MAHRKMILTEAGAAVYRTRMLSAGDPVRLGASDARLFAKHGWATEKLKRAKRPQLDHDKDGHEGGSITAAGDDLPALRAGYQTKFGKRPFNGWDAETLREKIANAD